MTTKQRFEELVSKGTAGDSGRPQEEQETLQKTVAARETIARMKGGEFPSTEELARALDAARGDEQLARAIKDMSPEGKKFMEDTGLVLETAKEALVEKNKDEELQKMMHHAGKAVETATVDRERLAGTGREFRKETAAAGELTRQAVDKITNVARLTVTSSEFRALLTDLTQLLHDIVLTNVAATPRPEGGEAKPADAAATTEGGEAGPTNSGAAPRPEGEEERVQGGGEAPGQQEAFAAPRGESPGEGVTQQQQASPEGGDYSHRAVLKETAHEATTKAGQQALDGAQSYLDQVKQQDRPTRETMQEAGKKFTQAARERAANVRLTDEQRETLINRVKNVARELHGSDEYQQAIEDLLDILSTLKSRAISMTSSIAEQTKQHAGEVWESAQQKHLDIATQNAKTLVEHFANNRSLDPLYNELMSLLREMREDRELDKLSDDAKNYILRILREPSFIDNPQFTDQGQQLVNRTRDIATDRYHTTTERLNSEAQDFLQGFREDELTMKLSRGINDLARDMFIDNESGKPTFKMDLARDLVGLIPIIAQKIKFIPLPRMESSDENYDYAVDNMVVSATNIMPEHVRISTQTDLKKIPEGGGKYDVNNLLAFTIKNVHAFAHKVAFYYKKKSGIARMADAGYADIVIQGRGLDIAAIVAVGNQHSHDRSFQVLRVDALVHNIDLTMQETKRDLMYKLFSPIVKSIVRKRLEEGIATSLLGFIVAFDKQITKTSQQSAAFASRMAEKGGEGMKQLRERRKTDEGDKDKDKSKHHDPEVAHDIPPHHREEQEAHAVEQQKLLQQKYQHERGDTSNGGAAAAQQQPHAETGVRKSPQQAM